MTPDNSPHSIDNTAGCDPGCLLSGMSRRDFLFATGFTAVAISIPGFGLAQGRRADYPRQIVAALSEIQIGTPLQFRYPWDHPNCNTVLLKLGRVASGGIGPDQDIVAFNGLCPHMGWEIPTRLFFANPGIAGPCPGHWTTFDLTRHGMVVSGHATQGLPQIVLELDGKDIVAVGILGLVFGFHDNKVEPK